MTGETERAKVLLADALGLSPEEIGPDASIETLAAWNSLAHMRLILAIEEEIGHEIDPLALVDMSSVRDIAEILDHA
jgi:acyl carrier protein